MATRVGKGNKPAIFNRYDANEAITLQYDKLISAYLKQVRCESGLNMVELGKLMNVSAAYISRVERCNYPTVTYMRYFPRVLKWLQFCGVQFQMSYIPVVDPANIATAEHYKQGGRRGLKVKKADSNQGEG